MLTIPKMLLIIPLAVFTTYIAENMGFAIVHSGVLLILTALLTPGFYVAFFNLVSSDWGTWILSGIVNSAYYYAATRYIVKRRARH